MTAGPWQLESRPMKPLPLVLAAAAASTAIAVTAASGQSAPAPAPVPRTFSVPAAPIPGTAAYVDTGKHGDSPGDVLATSQRLLEAGKPAGTATLTAISAGPGGRLLEFTATITLKDGTVTLAGLNGPGHHIALPIVGGTGAYAGARGVATITDRDAKPGTLVLSFAS